MRRLLSDGTHKRRTHSRQLVALVVRGGFLGHRRWLLLAKDRGDHVAEVVQDVTPVGHVLGYEHNHDVTDNDEKDFDQPDQAHADSGPYASRCAYFVVGEAEQ